MKKKAITDLNVPDGSRDIPFQCQKIEQDGHRHFPSSFLLDVTNAMLQDNKKNESVISQVSSV